MPPSQPCGHHVELANNGAVRVTRCSCGTVHVTLIASGVTVRMSADALRGATSGFKAALEKLDEPVHHGTTSIN